VSLAAKVHRVARLPSWWCWWLGTLEPSNWGASAITAGAAGFFADCRHKGDEVVSPAGKVHQGDPLQSWLRLGAPGLGVRRILAITAETAIAAGRRRQAGGS
jgi:hypothetical protein